MKEISKAAIDMLEMIINRENGKLKASFKTKLICRESTWDR